MKARHHLLPALAPLACITLISPFASGATATKGGTGTDVSSTLAGIWSGGSGTNGSPTTADVATWAAGSSTGAHTASSPVNWGSLSLSGNTAAVSISGSTITLASGGAGTTTILQNSSQALTIDNNLVATAVNNSGGVAIGNTSTRIQLVAAANTTLNGSFTASGGAGANDVNLTIRGSGTGVIGGTVTVDGQLYKADNGTWTLNGANSIGWVAINNGTLLGGNNAAFGSGTIYLGSGGGNMTLASADGTARSFGNKVDFGVLSFTGTATFGQTSGGTGALSFGELSLGTANRALAINANTSFTSVSGTTGGITKSGTGTLTLSGTNSYSGGTSITAGIVQANASGALGSGTIALSANSQRLSLGTGVTLSNNITLGSNSGAQGAGLLQTSSATGTASLEGTVTITANAAGGGHFANLGAGTFNVKGAITSSVPVVHRDGRVVYWGGGTGYSAMTVTGTAALGAANGLATSATLTLGGSAAGTFDLAGFNQSLTGIAKGQNAATIGNSSTSSDSALTTTGTSTFAGTIQDTLGSGNKKISLIVNGGTLTLSAANTYTGSTTVKAGTLKLDGAGAINSTNLIVGDAGSSGAVLDVTTRASDFTVGAGKTLSGIGLVDATGGKVVVNGTLAPGNSAGRISVSTSAAANGLTLGSTSTLSIEMTRGVTPDAGSNHDQLGLNGGLTIINGATLDLTAIGSGTWTSNDLYFLIANDGSDAITGTFDGIGEGTILTFDSQQFEATYLADSVGNSFTGGNDFALRVVPEPACLMFGGIGTLLLLRRRRHLSVRLR